ncbi:FecR family protein [Carboxylicivirga marina]|uniref:FecR domain-containing protein n=1 Tax=Carboxylicivirga marina TaxID=2800988 RepID=A0ABS1HIF5_9BACT|nr:FecR family protein [Carboxylicivirga marina]MBK3517446.1 FecR domain-containing protein [Carboxylicivirga marina]
MVKYQKKASIVIGCILIMCLSCTTNQFSTNNEAQLHQLKDGSIVVLNKHSAVQCNINDEKRIIVLKGEAFFKVRKLDVPFEVHTPTGVIKVLGTSFNVSASEEELGVEVDEGMVNVETVKGNKRLRRGEKLFYDDVKQVLKKGQAEFKHHIWTDAFKNDMHKLYKEIEKGGKQLGKEIENIRRELKIKL